MVGSQGLIFPCQGFSHESLRFPLLSPSSLPLVKGPSQAEGIRNGQLSNIFNKLTAYSLELTPSVSISCIVLSSFGKLKTSSARPAFRKLTFYQPQIHHGHTKWTREKDQSARYQSKLLCSSNWGLGVHDWWPRILRGMYGFYYVGMDGLNGISPSARTAYLDGHSTHHILRAADAPVGEHRLCV